MNSSLSKLPEIGSTVIFALAVIHTFCSGFFQRLARNYASGSIRENFFHLIGEVEVVFGFWAGVLILWFFAVLGEQKTLEYMEKLTFTEPLFIFAVMCISGSLPVLVFSRKLLVMISKLLPLPMSMSFYVICLSIGPLLGSLITEPAAITVCILLLKDIYFHSQASRRLKYGTLALLFVNISIGGALTPYAAPPILMVAHAWGWDLQFMLVHFGWKVILAITMNTLLITSILSNDIQQAFGDSIKKEGGRKRIPPWMIVTHLLALFLVVRLAQYPALFLGVFLYFLGIVTITREFQSPLKLRESLLIAYFLSGLIMLGQAQHWWLQPLLSDLKPFSLLIGSAVLTSFTDNAALTYLGSQVSGISEAAKQALVSGAIAGGGMTLIANAPNLVGFSMVQNRFAREGFRPELLAAWAFVPTLISMFCLGLL